MSRGDAETTEVARANPSVRIFDGANLYLPHPALMVQLDTAWLARLGDAAGMLSPEAAARLRETLLLHFPVGRTLDLAKNSQTLLSGGKPSPVVSIVAVVALELQRLADEPVTSCHVLQAQQNDAPPAFLVGFEARAIGRAAIPAACFLVEAAATWPPAAWNAPELLQDRSVLDYRTAVTRYGLDNSMRAVAAAARRRGIPVLRPDESLPSLQLGQGRHQRHVRNLLTDQTSQIGAMIADRKSFTALMLARLGLPVPRHEVVTTREQAIAAAERIGYPIVVKPDMGSQGKGVAIGLDSAAGVATAFQNARQFGQNILIEEFIPGQDYRMMVIGGRLVATASRRPAHVTGDGSSNVSDLIARENMDPLRGPKGRAPKARLTRDEDMIAVLDRQGLSPDSIPAAGVEVALRLTANLSTGGETMIVDDLVHPDNKRMAELIARYVGLDVIGIDLLTPDISQPFHAVRCAINEINTRPGLGPFTMPGMERPAVVEALLDMLFSHGDPDPLPMALLCGGKRAVATAQALHDTLRERGQSPACASPAGLLVDGVRGLTPPLTGDRTSAHALLCHPRADSGILAITPRSWRDQGVAIDHWRVLVLRDPSMAGACCAAPQLAAAIACPVVAEPAFVPVLGRIAAQRLILIDDGSPAAAAHRAQGGQVIKEQQVTRTVAELLTAENRT